jgi:hypothetical protein
VNSSPPTPPRTTDASPSTVVRRPTTRGLDPGRILVVVALLVMLTVSVWTGSLLPPVAGATPARHGVQPSVPPAPLDAAASSLRSGGGPARGITWSCPSSTAGTIRCSSPNLTPSPNLNNSSSWLPATAGPGVQPTIGFLVYDAKDGYDLLMYAGPIGSGNVSGPALYDVFQNGIWSSVSLTGPQYCYYASLTYDSSDRSVVYWAGYKCPSAGDTWTYQGGAWQNVTGASTPPSLYGYSLADDPGVSGLLWFGGACSTCNAGSNWTWKFVAGNWTNLSYTLTFRPSAEWWGSMSYDSRDGGVVLVSGLSYPVYVPTYTTWFFNGTWHAEPKVPIPVSSFSLLGPALADDPSGGYVLLVPSWNGTNTSGVSYQYTNGTWTAGALHKGLPESGNPLMVYDAGRAADILLDGGGLPETWSYASGNWTNLTSSSTGPGTRADIALAYDAADGYVVAFGGCACPPNGGLGGLQSDTWKFSSGIWTLLTTNKSPPARMQAGLVFDAIDGYVLLFGGVASYGTYNDSWEFTGGGWSPITPVASPPWSAGATMAYDAADNYVLFLTGAFPASTWTYHAGIWTNRTALGDRSLDGAPANPVVYDSTDGHVLLFGTAHRTAANATYVVAATWTFLGGNWTNSSLAASASPPPRSQASVADFPPGGFVVVFGGSQSWGTLSSPRNDTWAYSNGSWTELFPTESPGNRSDMPGTYDPSATADVFFGGFDDPAHPSPASCSYYGTCGDTWYWRGGSSGSFVVQVFTATPATLDLGSSTRLSVSVVGGTAPYSYVYTGLPSGCATANASTLTCTPSATGDWPISVLVTDSAGHGTSGQTEVTVGPALGVSAFFAFPTPTEVAERTLLSVQTVYGTPPLTYTYTGLPTGCLSQDVPTLPCTPTGTGNFTVHVLVHDAGGANASASLTLPVAASGSSSALQITGFRILPSTIVLGNTSMISVNATSSSTPLSYAYGNLPAGCSSANASSLLCLPTSAGTYGVTISVRDPLGDFASVGGNLTVDPVGGGAGLSISGFGASPGRTVVGSTVVLSVTASGGTGPLSYRYPTLPSGCVSANTSALPCAPTAPGTYSLYVVVADAASHSRGAVGTLEVVPGSSQGPAVSAFFASPANISLGNSTVLIVEARGTLPLSYAYTGLPTGCASANAGVLNCTPTDVGIFNVTVATTDAGGRTAWANTSFSVLPAVTGPKGPTNPIVPTASNAEPVLLWALIGVVVGAALSLTALELFLARRRLRADGEAIVRELSRGSPDDLPAPADRSDP